MRRHVSAEKLALYQEDLLSPRKRARIRSHLSRCDACAGTISALTAVPDLLSHAVAPPMPQQLAERITMALASEANARAGAALGARDARGEKGARVGVGADQAAPVTIPGRPDLPERARPRHRKRVPWLRMPDVRSPLVLRAVAATGVVVVIAGVGFVLANNQPSATSGNGSASGSPTRSVAAGSNHRPVANEPAAVPTDVHYRLKGKSATAPMLTSATNFTRRSVAKQAWLKRVRSMGGISTPTPSSTPSRVLSGVKSANITRLGPCLGAVVAGRKVLLVDLARYLGARAAIIILRPLRAINVLDVVVVRLTCSATDTHAIASFRVPSH